MMNEFKFIAHFAANAVNYNRLVTVVIGLCLNEVFALVVTRALGIASMFQAPPILMIVDLALTGVLFAFFYSVCRICKEVKSAWTTN